MDHSVNPSPPPPLTGGGGGEWKISNLTLLGGRGISKINGREGGGEFPK